MSLSAVLRSALRSTSQGYVAPPPGASSDSLDASPEQAADGRGAPLDTALASLEQHAHRTSRTPVYRPVDLDGAGTLCECSDGLDEPLGLCGVLDRAR